MIKLLKIFSLNILPSDRAMLKAFLLLYKIFIGGLLLYLIAISILKIPMVAIGIIFTLVIFLATAWYCEGEVIQEDLDEALERARKREEFKINLQEIAERREAEARRHGVAAKEHREAEL